MRGRDPRICRIVGKTCGFKALIAALAAHCNHNALAFCAGIWDAIAPSIVLLLKREGFSSFPSFRGGFFLFPSPFRGRVGWGQAGR